MKEPTIVSNVSDPWDRKTGFCCSTCAYYAPKDEKIGRCRRNAPTLSGFPVVYSTIDFCGEHKIGSNPLKDAFYKTLE